MLEPPSPSKMEMLMEVRRCAKIRCAAVFYVRLWPPCSRRPHHRKVAVDNVISYKNWGRDIFPCLSVQELEFSSLD